MDLHRIVRRVSDALGPAATAEQVERVAAVVFEEAHPSAPALPSDTLLLVAAGPASSGLLADLLGVLAARDLSPLEVVQRAGSGGAMVCVEVAAAGNAAEVEAGLKEVATRHAATLALYHGAVAAALLDA